MALSPKYVERISHQVVATLVTRFEKFPEDAGQNRNAPFHEAFLRAFAGRFGDFDIPLFISLSSWLHGLNTTLGQSFFERVAHIVSDGEKREYTSKKLGNLKITAQQKQAVNRIITELSNGVQQPDLAKENQQLFYPHPKNEETESAIDFSADVFYSIGDRLIAIELKTVKPNSGEMRGEKQKILEGKAALFNEFVNGNGEYESVEFYIGFPFDPTANPADDVCGFDKNRFFANSINLPKYFDPDESLIASELWDLLSGEMNTMQQILEIINAIATPQFMDEFEFVRDGRNRRKYPRRYREILKKWYLHSELTAVENETVILSKEPGLQRKFDQLIFDGHRYKMERVNDLVRVLTS